ncbi:hypothetical protein F0562_027886 [Nyssa sinensis]|uniref:Uncharacterized protein n=1 Tax=Nyssa sinensis TaxID=561372 RepID=A0A5J5BAQ7_9ASTE|nr:hypothetical protein F0562_027886 [Nyssa sinensis]
MVFSPPSHATINGLQAAKQHKSQGISTAALFNGSHINKHHHAHRVSDTHAQGATAVSNFEDGEVYANTPVAAMHHSPTRLTWADQASSVEFIPKEALDLEEEYCGFSVNSESLLGQDNHFPEVSINGGYNTGGSETGECRTRSKLATGKKPYSAIQPQQSRFPAIRKVTVQPLATIVAIQWHTQRADPIGDGQEDNLAGVFILVGQTSEGAHPNLYAAHGKAKGHAALPTDHTKCTATVTSKFNTLASSSSVGNTVPSQHEGLISLSTGVACPSIKVGCSDTAHPPTPNVALQVQAPSNVDQVQPLQPAPIPKPVSINADPIQAATTHSDNALRDAGDHTNPIANTTNSAIEQQIVHPEFQRINPMVTGSTSGGHSLKCPEIQQPDSLYPLTDIAGKNDQV